LASTLDWTRRVSENDGTINRHSEEVTSLSEPEAIRFACIDCGIYNPPSAEVCNACGHRFAGPDLVAKPRTSLPRRRSESPYEPPLTRIAPDRTLRIGSMLAWIAMIAVCLGALRGNLVLGLHATISFLPATVWTSIQAAKRRAEGRPMPLADRVSTFLVAMFGVWGIVIASVITFVVSGSCVGIMSHNLDLGLIVGSFAGVSCAVWLTHAAVSAECERNRRKHEIRYR
jgi:hypothetical protein